uniref:Cytochrome b6-f complex subunit 6 n=1 Tax=Edaphochlorella mirabilis TaxID=3083 RepID=A0A097KKL6_9CHLO|nr:subunit VI of cytochrome b6/f complex [Edaphochlorella mirabilis]AIT93740.1 subunit VI of cytochrome b6/f complex [Edaphochlorella mirabilis]
MITIISYLGLLFSALIFTLFIYISLLKIRLI